MKISYAIPVCNEYKEIEYLLEYLIKHKREEDEIIVQCDLGNTTDKVYEILDIYTEHIHTIHFALENNFAAFKNNLTENCTGDYIFQIDADEIPHEALIENLPKILKDNPKNEVYYIPRVNTVEGLTEEHIKQWGWRVNEKKWINWPDYQMRVWKNKPEIRWRNKVHEVLEGHINFSALPAEEELALYHPKKIDRQVKQNELYSKL